MAAVAEGAADERSLAVDVGRARVALLPVAAAGGTAQSEDEEERERPAAADLLALRSRDTSSRGILAHLKIVKSPRLTGSEAACYFGDLMRRGSCQP